MADRRRLFRLSFRVPFLGRGRACPGLFGSCEDAAELAVLSSPAAPWKGAPLRVIFAAEKPLDGELSLIAPEGSVAAKSRGRARRAALFLVRRGGVAGRGDVAREARARRRAGRVRHDHARNRRRRRRSRRRRPRRRAASGRCATPGTARRKTCIRHGSRSCSTRRSTPSRRGRRCMRCCATDRAISCSTISALGEDEVPMVVIRPDCADLRLFPARLFRLQDGAAVRLLEVLARRRRQAAEVLRVVHQRRERRTRQGRARPSFGRLSAGRRRRRAVRRGARRRRTTTTPIIIPCR